MIIITLKDDTQKRFNLKNFEREQALQEMWSWCFNHDDTKIFKMRTTKDELLTLKVSEIKHLEFDKSEFVDCVCH